MSDAAEARRALTALVGADDDDIDLPRAALLIAREEYPGLDAQAYLDELDRLGDRLRERLGPIPPIPGRQIAELNALLFGEEGFRGNEARYYDPRNSYLNQVLERRLGIPITLSLIYVEVGRRAGLPLKGVSFPAHFLVAFETVERLLIDPFNCGRLLRRDDCAALLRQMFGNSVKLEAGHLQATRPRDILVRLVSNLKAAYERAGDLRRALRADDQLAVVRGVASDAKVGRHQMSLIRDLRERLN